MRGPWEWLNNLNVDCLFDNAQVELEVVRVPLQEDQMPTEYIDVIVDILKTEPASTPCVFSCQMGKGRTSLGMVAACLVKEITITAELRFMKFCYFVTDAGLRVRKQLAILLNSYLKDSILICPSNKYQIDFLSVLYLYGK